VQENNFIERVTQAHPVEIYVPTAATNHNLNLIECLSPIATWANAPESIRQPPHMTPKATYRPTHTENNDKQRSKTAKRAFPDLSPDSKTETIRNNNLATLNIP
jgi:hypothetical protein